MKVLFPDISNPSSGRGYFLNALANEFPSHDVEVVYEGDHDISLHSIRMFCKSKKPRILRLDGVYHNTAQDYKSKNDGLRNHAEAADGIICQSEFSKQMVMRYLGIKENKIRVIFNGAKIHELWEEDKSLYRFIAISKWRPHKRLKDIIDSFNLAAIPNSILHVWGDIDNSNLPKSYKKQSEKIYFMGNCNHESLIHQFDSATASIHLCWFDACPNSVVESIIACCPVITNNVGGTHEIVKPSNGIVLNLDLPYNYSPVDLYNPPPIEIYKVADAMRKCVEKRPSIINSHVDIKNIAEQYKNYFEIFI